MIEQYLVGTNTLVFSNRSARNYSIQFTTNKIFKMVDFVHVGGLYTGVTYLIKLYNGSTLVKELSYIPNITENKEWVIPFDYVFDSGVTYTLGFYSAGQFDICLNATSNPNNEYVNWGTCRYGTTSGYPSLTTTSDYGMGFNVIIPFTLTVNYKYENGNTAYPSYTNGFYYGGEYTVESPLINGYGTNTLFVNGIMPDSNVVVEVVYSIRHVLTIHYKLYDGSIIYESYINNMMEVGQSYSIESPIIEGWITERLLVEGTISNGDKLEEVVYLISVIKLEINSVSITPTTVNINSSYLIEVSASENEVGIEPITIVRYAGTFYSSEDEII